MSSKNVQTLDRVVIRFAGDSGDGMQLTGDRFTSDSAVMGNDLSTLPNFPAEIRAPQGTLPGVLQLPAALRRPRRPHPRRRPRRARRDEPRSTDGQPRRRPARGDDHRQHRRVHQAQPGRRSATPKSPVDDGSLDSFHVHPVALTSITVEALAEFTTLTRKEKERAKNMFALGLLPWMYTRPTTGTEAFLKSKFGARPEILAANLAALTAGWNYGETTEDFASSFVVSTLAKMPAGTYRNITGNTALPPAAPPPPTAPASPSCWAPTRSRRHPTSSTCSQPSSATASRRCRPRTRSPASASPWARASAGRSASRRRAAPVSR